MVPRFTRRDGSSRPTGLSAFLLSVFAWWRRALGFLSTAPSSAPTGHGKRSSIPLLFIRYLRNPADAIAGTPRADIRALGALGLMALLLGTALGAALEVRSSGLATPALLGAAATLMWALVRLGIMLALTRSGPGRREMIAGAWGAGLLPYVASFSVPLSIVAFGASALLTYSGLVGALSGQRRAALRLVAWAFGGQSSVVFFGWVLRNAAVFLLWFETQ